MYAALPHIFRLPLHSPLQKIKVPAFEEKAVELYIKRDDLLHPFVSGNKWRKLKYNLLEAAESGKNRLLTFGGAYSNHLLATAAAAAACGMSSTGLVRGDEQVNNHQLFLCRSFGMELHFIPREIYRNQKEALAEEYGGPGTCILPEGGSNAMAVKGCAEVLEETDATYHHILLAAGTGGTTAGIALGASIHMPAARVHAIAALKGADFLRSDIEKLAPGLHNWELHTRFHRGGYAHYDPSLLQLIQDFASGTGILLDQVYTAKMFAASLQLLQEAYFKPGEKVLLLHTGGLCGYLSLAGQ